MNRVQLRKLRRELDEYVEQFVEGMGRLERREALALYVTGLLLDGERKSIAPMAARLVDADDEVEAMRQRLQQAVVIAGWEDHAMLGRLAEKLDRELPGVEALVIDDTGLPKKGAHSVGVQRQYSGTLGRVDNCQVAVSVHLAGEQGSGMVGFRLFLPESWASDAKRRAKAGVPEEVEFRTKGELALAELDRVLTSGVRRHVVLADAGYGDSHEFRAQLARRRLEYIVAVNGEPVVWAPWSRPRVGPKRAGKAGRPPSRVRDAEHPPIALKALAPLLRFRRVTWREGARGWQSGDFAAVRLRTAHRHQLGAPPGQEQWLLCQRTGDTKTPYKFWLSNLPATAAPATLVRLAKLRWRIERDYQELKGELGLDHFEGRTWRGLHHHATLCAVAHGFLALRRALFPPEANEVDAAPSPPRASASPARKARSLSTLPKTHRPKSPATRAF